MAYVAVDKDGTECIYVTQPLRDDNVWIINDCWIGDGSYVILPKGTIKKLIGRELTWNDEPVKIK